MITVHLGQHVFGVEEGETCRRPVAVGEEEFACEGLIQLTEVENCSCHISPPCGACMAQHRHCACCGWDEADDK